MLQCHKATQQATQHTIKSIFQQYAGKKQQGIGLDTACLVADGEGGSSAAAGTQRRAAAPPAVAAPPPAAPAAAAAPAAPAAPAVVVAAPSSSRGAVGSTQAPAVMGGDISKPSLPMYPTREQLPQATASHTYFNNVIMLRSDRSRRLERSLIHLASGKVAALDFQHTPAKMVQSGQGDRAASGVLNMVDVKSGGCVG